MQNGFLEYFHTTQCPVLKLRLSRIGKISSLEDQMYSVNMEDTTYIPSTMLKEEIFFTNIWGKDENPDLVIHLPTPGQGGKWRYTKQIG